MKDRLVICNDDGIQMLHQCVPGQVEKSVQGWYEIDWRSVLIFVGRMSLGLLWFLGWKILIVGVWWRRWRLMWDGVGQTVGYEVPGVG